MALGTLSIDLVAKLANLESGLDKAARIAERDSARMERAFGAVKAAALGISSALGGALSIHAGVQFVETAIDAADAAAKQARQVGLLTEEISALNYAASLAGVNQDELTAALVKMSKSAHDADKGLGSAVETYRELGVSVHDSAGNLKSQSQLLDEVSDAFAAMPDGIRKTALATEVFGRAGAKLINLLGSGSGALGDMRREAEQTGKVIGTDTANASERLNDNISRLKASVDGLGLALATALLPSLNAVSERLVAAVKTFDSFGEFFRLGFKAQTFTDAAEGVDFYGKRVSKLRDEIAALHAQGGVFSTIKANAQQKELDDASKLLEFYQRVASAQGTLGAGGGRGALNPPFALHPTGEPGAGGKAGAGKAPAIPYALTFDQETGAFVADAETRIAFLKTEKNSYEELDKALQDLAASTAKAADEQRALRDITLNFGEDQSDAETARLKRMEAVLEATPQALREVYKESKKTIDIAAELGLTFSSALEDAIVQGNGLRDVLHGLEQDILRIVTRKLITEPLGNAVSGFLSKIISGGAGGGFDIGSWFSKLFSGFFASGGFIPAGRWGIAGEKGPEPVFGGRTGATVQRSGLTVQQSFIIAGPVDLRGQQQIAAAAASGVARASSRFN